MKKRGRFCTLVVLMYMTMGAAVVEAGPSINWQRPAGSPGDWFDAYNWDLMVPTATASTRIDNGGTATIDSGDAVSQLLTIGVINSGALIQSGGTNSTETLTMATGSTGVGRYELRGGSLTADWAHVGVAGVGEFVHSSGTFQSSGLAIGGSGSPGPYGSTYHMSGDAVLTTGLESVGAYEDGTFVQLSGTHAVTSDLRIAGSGGHSGTFELWGGTLQANAELVGVAGRGVFEQYDGMHRVTNNLYVSYGTSPGLPSGVFNLRDGTLEVGGNEYIGYDFQRGGLGEFSQTGGTHTIDGQLMIGREVNGLGQFNMQNGSLSVGGDLIIGERILSWGKFQTIGGLAQINVQGSLVMGPFNKPDNTPELGALIDQTGLATIHVRDTATLQGFLDVEFAPDFTPSFGQEFEVLRADGGISGSLTLTGKNADDVSLSFHSNSITLTSIVPEPSSFVLLAMGAVVLVGCGWCMRKRASR